MELIYNFRDDLLIRICCALQLTEDQFGRAERSYKAVGKWLADDLRFDRLNPRIYAQGSMALQTTVRPRGRVEYDLDLIFEVDSLQGMTPGLLYEAIKERLSAHGTYRQILEPHARCLRLTYKDDFHLDIVPARTHPRLGAPFIEIPQKPEQRRELHSWVTNNPKGFVEWFKAESTKRLALLEKAYQEPLPQPTPGSEKPVLAQAVQLFKRHRDVIYDGADDAPSSIILTTLAGSYYNGEASVERCIINILERIEQLSQRDKAFSSVTNPVCPDQKLCSGWTTHQCNAFADFIRTFRLKMKSLTTIRGLEEIAEQLRALFGDETLPQKMDDVSKAITRYVEETVNQSRQSGSLSFLKSGALSTVPGAGISVPKNTFYGED